MIRKFKFSGETNFALLFCNILASDPKTWYWTEFWSGVTWLNYAVVLSAVKTAETKLFSQRNLLLVM